MREAVDAQDGDLANAREDRHDHGVGNAESAQQKAASAHRPGRGLENFELRIGARELRVFQGNQVGELRLDHALECSRIVLVAQLDGDDRGSFLPCERSSARS